MCMQAATSGIRKHHICRKYMSLLARNLKLEYKGWKCELINTILIN